MGRVSAKSWSSASRDAGRGEQEALHFLAAGEAKQHALLLGLNAFGQQRHVERAAKRHDRLHQRLAAGVAASGATKPRSILSLSKLNRCR